MIKKRGLQLLGAILMLGAVWICWRLFYWHFVAVNIPSNLPDFAIKGGLIGFALWTFSMLCFAAARGDADQDVKLAK